MFIVTKKKRSIDGEVMLLDAFDKIISNTSNAIVLRPHDNMFLNESHNKKKDYVTRIELFLKFREVYPEENENFFYDYIDSLLNKKVLLITTVKGFKNKPLISKVIYNSKN